MHVIGAVQNRTASVEFHGFILEKSARDNKKSPGARHVTEVQDGGQRSRKATYRRITFEAIVMN